MSEEVTKNLENRDPKPADILLDGPCEFLVKSLCDQILCVPQFKLLFGGTEQQRGFVDPYQRADYSMRSLPALRVYNLSYTKETESWFINGDLILDLLMPADVRREDLEQWSDTIAAALLQQFRRPKFFDRMCELVPGLNELGKVFAVDKSLVFSWGENEVPLTQMRSNFRLDLRAWDQHLEDTLRTKDQPFEQTLGVLRLISSKIRGLNDDESTNVEIDMLTNLKP